LEKEVDKEILNLSSFLNLLLKFQTIWKDT